jgi:hypothetical protein
MCYSTSTIRKQGWWPLVARHVSAGSTCHGHKRSTNQRRRRQQHTVYLSLSRSTRHGLSLSLSHAAAPLPPSSLLRCASSSLAIPDLRGGSEGGGLLRARRRPDPERQRRRRPGGGDRPPSGEPSQRQGRARGPFRRRSAPSSRGDPPGGVR